MCGGVAGRLELQLQVDRVGWSSGYRHGHPIRCRRHVLYAGSCCGVARPQAAGVGVGNIPGGCLCRLLQDAAE
eukprot:361304-Chlamydomonas_euryale.AAC.2